MVVRIAWRICILKRGCISWLTTTDLARHDQRDSRSCARPVGTVVYRGCYQVHECVLVGLADERVVALRKEILTVVVNVRFAVRDRGLFDTSHVC